METIGDIRQKLAASRKMLAATAAALQETKRLRATEAALATEILLAERKEREVVVVTAEIRQRTLLEERALAEERARKLIAEAEQNEAASREETARLERVVLEQAKLIYLYTEGGRR